MKKSRVRELYEQYVGAMEDWQIRLALSRMMYYGVPQDAWDDTMQELAIVVHAFRFEAAKAHAASERTILCRRLDNRVRMLARGNARRLAMQDRLRQMTQNVEDTRTPEGVVGDGEVHALIRQLSPLQQEICRALMDGLSVYQVARLTGRHYTTIRRQVEHIRQAFADRGFDKWRA